MQKPELLAPAGSLEKAKTAFKYGADAVYMGTSNLSLRSRVTVDDDELIKTIEYAHSINKKVYAALNIYARDNMYEEIENQINILKKAKVDALIISDGGIVEMARTLAPEIPIHISTQANVTSYHTSNFWKKNGAERVILARELNKEEIKEIKNNTDLEIEIFVHGAICYSYSGRCNLSDFLASRCGNLGDCAQSCRWAYNMYIEEKNNPGNLMPVEQDQNGTYILSSKDLCLIKEIPEIVDMGIDSLKIEGRLKTEYYLATVISAYRNAIDDYIKNPEEYDYTKYLKELEKTKTRGLTTFYFNDKNNRDFQEYEGKQYNPDFEFGGKVLGKNEDGKDVINPAREKEDEYVLTSRVRYLEEDGDLYWVKKDINDSAIENHKKTIMDLICLCSFVTNKTDLGFTQADNNSALEKKFFSLQQLISTFRGLFKAGYTRRWELILNKINKDKAKTYDFRDIETVLNVNLPTDTSTETSRVLSLRDLLADETLINMLPDDLDAKNEIAKKKQEAETNLEENQELMKKFSNNTENNNDENLDNEAKEEIDSTPGEVIKGSKEKEDKPDAIESLDKLKK